MDAGTRALIFRRPWLVRVCGAISPMMALPSFYGSSGETREIGGVLSGANGFALCATFPAMPEIALSLSRLSVPALQVPFWLLAIRAWLKVSGFHGPPEAAFSKNRSIMRA